MFQKILEKAVRELEYNRTCEKENLRKIYHLAKDRLEVLQKQEEKKEPTPLRQILIWLNK